MDPAIVSAMSAVLGSVVGGSASIATAWFTQKSQSLRESVRSEIQKRETLYSAFIAECSTLAIDALEHPLEKADNLIKVYALHNQIRLFASEPVIDAATQAIRRILELYFGPNMTKAELHDIVLTMKEDPLRLFSEACRFELKSLRSRA